METLQLRAPSHSPTSAGSTPLLCYRRALRFVIRLGWTGAYSLDRLSLLAHGKDGEPVVSLLC
jgi:hypothetical protein